MIFAVIFALLGGFIIWRTFAAENVIAKAEAESMTLPPGAVVVSDPSASGGKVVKMITSGSLEGTVNLPSKATSVSISAFGTKCNRSWPSVQVFVDNVRVVSRTVNSTTLKSFSNKIGTNLNLQAGQHKVEIRYTVAGEKGCVLSLSVDRVNFMGSSTTPTTPLPTVSLTANPSSVTAGQPTTLSWTTTNATSCSATGSWSGTKAVNGTQSVAPAQTGVYGLTCSGLGGSASGSVNVTVNPVSPPPPPPPPSTLSTPNIVISPSAQTLANGGTLTFEVRENSGNVGVNAVQVNLTYPSNLLEYVGVDSSTSAFAVPVPPKTGAGTLGFAMGSYTPLTGDRLVAKVTFRAKATGTGNISFSTGTSLISEANSQNILTSLNSTRGLSLTVN